MLFMESFFLLKKCFLRKWFNDSEAITGISGRYDLHYYTVDEASGHRQPASPEYHFYLEITHLIADSCRLLRKSAYTVEPTECGASVSLSRTCSHTAPKRVEQVLQI